jgi:hypothetical protein
MENFEEYAQQMQKMYADAFAAAEVMKNAAIDDRNAAAMELSHARDLRKAAEQNGEQMALEYFAKRRKDLVEQTREETLSALVLMHLKNEKTEEDIMEWLDADEELITHCKIILKKQKQMADNPHIDYSQTGRGGTLTYIAGKTRINFDWEFAGGNGVAIIFIPEEKYWEAQTRTPLSARQEILEFVAKEVVEAKAPNCIYRITDGYIDILYK